MVGKTLGHYGVLEKIGAGGMGEVYRARDTRLGRDVAIKVLPDTFARNAERLARFEQEARLLASLNHPNIAAIHGLEESHGIRALVMELVEGPTLADRITQGPIPLDEALPIARQIAEAVEYAHERGIIHRDLKPANVKVTAEGKVKVLDFGLAKAFGDDPASADLSKSPTASYGSSREGVILGTAAYMSPEQARGKPMDKRTDIWSFGCVLYEALTGRKAFSGETVSDTIAKILEREPEWQALPAHTPANMQVLLRRCLQKDPRRRLHDIADARLEFEEGPIAAATGLPTAQTPRPADWRRALPWSLAALVALLAIGVVVFSLIRIAPPVSRPVTRFAVTVSPTDQPAVMNSSAIALSPDGTVLVYAARRGETTQLFLRPLDQLQATPMPGTDGAIAPFFSPNGEWVGFFAGGKLEKVSIQGGTPQIVCDSLPLGGTWASDDTILFTPDPVSGLMRVSAAGGTPQPVTTPDAKKEEVSHRQPEVLPGGKAVLFTTWTGGSFDDARIAVQRLDTGERRVLLEGGYHARYAPSGHLVYARAGALLATRFDLARLEVTGPAVPVLEGVITNSLTGNAQVALSASGTLAYVPGTQAAERSLVWVDRRGVERPLAAPRQGYLSPNLSPNGQQVATALIGANFDVWVYDLARGALTRLTFDPDWEGWPIWAPDGKRVTFTRFHGGHSGLFWKRADGSGSEEQLTTSEFPLRAESWSPDGRLLVFSEFHRDTTKWDISVLPLDDRKPRPFLQTPFNELGAQFSPDGRWIAYHSDESGRPEVYVQPYPGPSGRWQISTEGGAWPLWAPSGRELFYRNGDKMMAVAVSTKAIFSAGKPRLLFKRHYWAGFREYDIARDAQRFLMVKPTGEESAPTQINVVLNWFEELKRRVPAKQK